MEFVDEKNNVIFFSKSERKMWLSNIALDNF